MYIANNGKTKGRLIKKDGDWYIAEWKYVADVDEAGNPQVTGRIDDKSAPANIWWPWVGGTAEYLCLTEQDKAWAKST